jgi:superfamily II DNA or RNA helicase
MTGPEPVEAAVTATSTRGGSCLKKHHWRNVKNKGNIFNVSAEELSDDALQRTNWGPGTEVYKKSDPAQQGWTTGNYRGEGQFTYVEVKFGRNHREFVPVTFLGVVIEDPNPEELFAERSFSRPDDLRRLMTWTKLSGDLTSVFYSMEGSNTEFMPHQFKPVLKFIESIEGRILIADEVGLGKTIEAIYIWRELQARSDARRLLIVCPSMLTRKWQDDLWIRFHIRGRIVRAAELHEELLSLEQGRADGSFVLITSIEGIRVRDEKLIDGSTDSRARLSKHLSEPFASRFESLFDLVVVDEAHYLRNPATASNQTVARVRDRTDRLVLLSATPIQTADENLFQLLHLLSPDVFYDVGGFRQLLEDNQPIVRATNILRAGMSDRERVIAELSTVLSSTSFRSDFEIQSLRSYIEKSEDLTLAQSLFWAERLEAKNLFSKYICRTRKRDVYPNRAFRSAHTIEVFFAPEEEDIYMKVTRALRKRSAESSRNVEQFTLLTRQRQMASCLVAALEAWQGNESMEEILWEDLGIMDDWEHQSIDSVDLPSMDQDTIQRLEAVDSKYSRFREAILETLNQNPYEKIVVFAFFRATLAYLNRRLADDGVSSIMLRGGGGDERFQVIDTFRLDDGPSVLLSSEVGSEGIDLQFARVVVNYDLPWNPMRVEQRIGRVDRIGQKADRISIINLARYASVDDRIVMRLYERIGIFRDSIGDLEPIMGDLVEQLVSDYLDPQLTDREREERAEEQLRVLELRRQEIGRLEEKALQLMGFTDYLSAQAREAHDAGRWVRPEELRDFVRSFLDRSYGGTRLREIDDTRTLEIQLSSDAQRSFGDWIARNRPEQMTRLHRADRLVKCAFRLDDNVSELRRLDLEYVNVTHPLIQWTLSELENAPESFHRSFAGRIQSDTMFRSGVYVVSIEQWEAVGFRRDRRLAYAGRGPQGEVIKIDEVESLINLVLERGEIFHEARFLSVEYDKRLEDVFEEIDREFRLFAESFRSSNRSLCDQQIRSAEKTHQRKRQRILENADRYRQLMRETGKTNYRGLISAQEKKIAETDREFLKQKDRIDRIREAEIRAIPIAVGVVEVVS